MILVGLNYKWGCVNGDGREGKDYFESKDIHEAAVETIKRSWSNSWQYNTIWGGEFHDTETHKTWSVDSGGHTQRDYRNESENVFRNRWNMEGDKTG